MVNQKQNQKIDQKPARQPAHAVLESAGQLPEQSLSPAAVQKLSTNPQNLLPSEVIGLQHSVGNRSIAQRMAILPENAIQGQRSARTRTADVGLIQRAPKRPLSNQTANLARLATLRSNADTRYKLTNDFAVKSQEVGDLTRDKLGQISTTYREAYNNFRAVLNRAQQEAQNQQDWTNIIVGVVMGVAAGLLAAWALPASASAAFTLTLEEAAIAGVSSGVQGAAGAAASAGITSKLDVAGKNLDSSGLDPSIMDLAIWKKAADIYRSGLEYSRLSGQLHSLTVSLSDFIGDVRVFAAGGETTLTEQTINEKITAMEGKDAAQASLNTELTTKIADLEAIKQAVSAIDPSKKNVRQMEKDIWILWMASLSRDSNILDLDEIENHIGPKGLGIVDFGIYTSDADENEAIENARDTANMLRAEQQMMLNPGTEVNVPGDKNRQLRILTL